MVLGLVATLQQLAPLPPLVLRLLGVVGLLLPLWLLPTASHLTVAPRVGLSTTTTSPLRILSRTIVSWERLGPPVLVDQVTPTTVVTRLSLTVRGASRLLLPWDASFRPDPAHLRQIYTILHDAIDPEGSLQG